MRPKLVLRWLIQFEVFAAAQFVAQDSQLRRAIEAQANAITVDLHNRDYDVLANRDSLTKFAG
jgi:hypothetical protein